MRGVTDDGDCAADGGARDAGASGDVTDLAVRGATDEDSAADVGDDGDGTAAADGGAPILSGARAGGSHGAVENPAVVVPGAAADRTRATTRRNAARRSFSFSATSASARQTHGLLGH